MHDELTRLATHDALTGLLNRRGLLAALEQWLAHRCRTGEQITVAMFDVIRFKAVNDDLGHSVGDQVLCQVGAALRSELRASDALSRWGGDEFVAVLPRTGEGDAEALLARLQAAVRSVRLPDRVVEARGGLATAPEGPVAAQDLLLAASDDLHARR
jgi:diguanylate cyclase (GGDEF)-like protein